MLFRRDFTRGGLPIHTPSAPKSQARDRSRPPAEFGFEDALSVIFAAWAVIGHFAFFAGVGIKTYWLLAWSVSVIIACLFLARTSSWIPGPSSFDGEVLGVKKDRVTWLAILFAVTLTLCLHRPDADDRTYLGQEVRALDHPEASFRTLANVPEYNAGYVMSTYEYLRAGFSWLTGIPVLVSYYLIWPAVITAMSVAFQSRLLRLFGVESLGFALIMWFVVMLAWGDSHRTPPNFGLVRIFQGKIALVWATIPSALYYWLRFVEFRERRSLLLLWASVIAGVGFSPTGVPTGVLLIGLFVAATLIRGGVSGGKWRVATAVAGGAIYPLVVGLLMRSYFGHTPDSGLLPGDIQAPPASVAAPSMARASPAAMPPMVVAQTPRDPTRDVSRVAPLLVLGKSIRTVFAISCAAAIPLFLRPSAVKGLFSVYSILCTLLLVFPWTSELMGTFAFSSFSWRWLFVIPFVLGIVIVVERVATWFRHPWARCAVAITTALAFVLVSPDTVLSERNNTRLKTPGFKLPSDDVVALAGYAHPAKVDGWWLISPATGARR